MGRLERVSAQSRFVLVIAWRSWVKCQITFMDCSLQREYDVLTDMLR